MLFVLGSALLVGLDLYLSNRRMRNYGIAVELNPVAKQLARDQGVTAAVVFLALWNIALLIGLDYYSQTLLHVFFGAKLGLGAMQLKSLEMESLVEKLLQRKPNVKTNSSN